jgi:hypothetical protein
MRVALIATMACIGLIASALAGDLTIKSTIENKGMVGMLDMAGTQQTTISGDMMREESTIKMTGKTMKMLGGGKPQETIKITRLDKELFWDISPKEKEYTELTFAELRKQMTEMTKDGAKAHPSDSIQAKTDIQVERTGKKQTIAGYNAEQVIVIVTITGKDAETGKTSEFKVNMDMWLSKDVPGLAEYKDFHKRLAEKLGLFGPNEAFTKAFASLGANQEQIWEKMKDIDGFPLMTSMDAMPLSDSLVQAMKQAEKQQAEAEQKSEEKQEAEATPAIDPTTASKDDAEAAATKALKGLFGKKKKDKKSDEAKAGAAQSDAPRSLFHIVSTVTEISTAPATGTSFDLPVGYKKK